MKRLLGLGAFLGSTLALIGAVTLAFAQGGGPGFFISFSCTGLANKVAGQTWCASATAPYMFQVWDGAAFSNPTLTGPYAPTTFASNGVLYGNAAGALQASASPTDNQMLVSVAGGPPEWSSLPIIRGLKISRIAGGQDALWIQPNVGDTLTGRLLFFELSANGTNAVSFRAPTNIASDVSWTLPSSDGTNGFALVTDGAGTLSWASIGGGGGSGLTSLNGLTAAIQTFANDTNVTMVSATSTHTITWSGLLAVGRGGTGASSLTTNGVLLGNNTSAVTATAAGTADQVLRVPGGGGAPAFGAVAIDQAAATSGTLLTARLGSGTANASTFLRGDQTWSAPAGVPIFNYVWNSDFELWGAGTSAAPTGWQLAGAGATAARNTTANQFRIGTASVAVTRNGTDVTLFQPMLVIWPTAPQWQNQVVTCGAWVRATVASRAYVALGDGIGTTSSATHSGGSAFEFLTVSRTIGGAATAVNVGMGVKTGDTTAQFDGAICVLGGSVGNWQPSGYPGRSGTMTHTSGATQYAANTTYSIGTFMTTHPVSAAGTTAISMPYRAIVRSLQARAAIAPGGAATATYTVMVDAVDSAVTCQIAGANLSCSDTANATVIARGAKVQTKIVTSVGTTVAAANAILEFEEVPEGI